MAMEHFHERGFQHYAYFGHSRYAWCKSRGYAFREKVRERGLYFEGYESTASRGAAWNDAYFLEWLRSLPKPVGIFCCNDRMGLQVINGCRREGIRTPDEVSVLGVGNHQLICKMSAPALSSIILNTHEAGYQAAASLDQWMKNGTPDFKGIAVGPVEISARASTDALAIEDQDVVTALRFIRANATKGIKVLEVLETVDLSRRVFESRFKKFTGRTPHEEIDRVKLDKVKMLLRETDQTLPEIAKHCGYRHPEYLSAVFARKVGISPSVFRKSCLKSRLFED
jgi:LacI family transcriptional regulator